MSRRRPALLAIGSLAVVLAVLLLVAPSGATGCARAVPADLHSDDGRWLVLRVSGCTEGVHAYDRGWRNSTELQVGQRVNATYGYPSFSALVASHDAGWWFVSDRGRAYRFSEDLHYRNRTLTLPVEHSEYLTGVAIDGAGRWWMATSGETTVYDPAQNETVRTFDRGGTDLVVRNGSVWFLTDGRKGGLVEEYDIRENTGRLTLRERATHELGPEVFNPTVFTRGPDGRWWVYSKYERAFAYDQHWRYAGEPASSGSVVSGMLFLFPALSISFVGSWVLALRIATSELPRRPLSVYLGSGAVAAVLAVSVRESLMPSLLSFVYWPPDQFVAALLVLPTAAGVAFLERRSWFRILFVVVANLPLLVVAWDFWTSVG